MIRFRRFDPSRDDGAALRDLHARALRDAGTDPADVPATDDLDRVPEAYLEGGGEFLVGIPESMAEGAATGDEVVAMGGFRPLADVGAGGHEGFTGGGAAPDAAVELYRSRGYDEVDRMREGPYELVRFEKRIPDEIRE